MRCVINLISRLLSGPKTTSNKYQQQRRYKLIPGRREPRHTIHFLQTFEKKRWKKILKKNVHIEEHQICPVQYNGFWFKIRTNLKRMIVPEYGTTATGSDTIHIAEDVQTGLNTHISKRHQQFFSPKSLLLCILKESLFQSHSFYFFPLKFPQCYFFPL